MKKPKFKDEKELARIAVDWLLSQGWEVFQEVKLRNSDVIDIVAVKDGIIWAIECKTTLGAKVLEQAHGKLDFAHKVSIAVPWGSYSLVYDHFLRSHGIGKLFIRRKSPDAEVLASYGIIKDEVLAKEILDPDLAESPKKLDGLKSRLYEEQKNNQAGSRHGSVMTPFKITHQKVVEYLKTHGPSPVSQIVKNISHHYTSNRTAVTALTKVMLKQPELFVCSLDQGRKIFYLR